MLARQMPEMRPKITAAHRDNSGTPRTPDAPLHTVGGRLRCSGCDRTGADIYLAELPDP
ncbi:MAG: hypothetical protein ACRYG8_30340 [Janthinobacterium lividum]